MTNSDLGGKGNVGRKWFVLLALPYNSSQFIIRNSENRGYIAGQEPGGRSLCKGHGEMLLTALLLMDGLACFHMEPSTNNPRVALQQRTRPNTISH